MWISKKDEGIGAYFFHRWFILHFKNYFLCMEEPLRKHFGAESFGWVFFFFIKRNIIKETWNLGWGGENVCGNQPLPNSVVRLLPSKILKTDIYSKQIIRYLLFISPPTPSLLQEKIRSAQMWPLTCKNKAVLCYRLVYKSPVASQFSAYSCCRWAWVFVSSLCCSRQLKEKMEWSGY